MINNEMGAKVNSVSFNHSVFPASVLLSCKLLVYSVTYLMSHWCNSKYVTIVPNNEVMNK